MYVSEQLGSTSNLFASGDKKAKFSLISILDSCFICNSRQLSPLNVCVFC